MSAGDVVTEQLARWSLERVRFLLAHVGDFVDQGVGTDRELRDRALNFRAQTGLDQVGRLTLAEPSDPALPALVLERLAAFFDAGLLVRLGPGRGWYVTDVFGRGVTFHLNLDDQVAAPSLVPELTPLQVHHAAAAAVLNQLSLNFLSPAPEARAYLIRPAPGLAFVLISNLAPPFAVDHVARAHELVNQCFLY